MRKKRYPKQKNNLKTSLKITMGVIAVTSGAMILILLVVFNFSRQESSMAGSPMVYVGSDTMQDTTPVYRGSVNQQGVGLVIQTSGSGNPLNITSLEFKTWVSLDRVNNSIENARLWYTGDDPEFSCISQVGSTYPVITEEAFALEVNKVLKPGRNYFWLTFDIKTGTNPVSHFDVSCTNIKVGALNYQPVNHSPSGSRLISGNLSFYSQGDLLINHPDSWNSKRDGSGDKPKDIQDQRNVYFIQNGHHMQCLKNVSMETMIIENGGYLKSMSAVRLKNMFVETGGTYHQAATITDYYAFQNFTIDNHGIYIHDNTGYIPGLNCDFKTHSTQKFLQYGQATFSYTTAWGNVIIASGSKINFDIQKNFHFVKGNLEFQMTGGDNYLFCDGNDTMNIGGDLIFSGGNFTGVTGRNHVLNINVEGDLIITKGLFTDAQAVGTTQSHTLLNIGGNVNFSGGTFDFAQSAEAASELNFIDSHNKQVIWTQTGGEILLGNVRVLPGKELMVNGPFFGDLASAHSFIVENNATLMCGKNQLTGTGRFVLEDNATIGIGHAEGLNSNGSLGNIITTKRVFNSGANYVYYMEMNPQKTGKFATEPWNGNVRNFTVNKDGPSQWVILSQDFNVIDHINIYQGIVEKNSRRLLKSDLSQLDFNKMSASNKKKD